MAELEIAKQDMYGYRQVMPDHRTRVRVFAGTPIPPDLVDLESAGDELQPQTIYDTQEATSATMSEAEQQAAHARWEADKQAVPVSTANLHDLKKDDLVARAEAAGVDSSGTKDELVERLEKAGA